MTKISEIDHLPLDELRPIVQRALGLPEWPGDWPAAGLIFNMCGVQTARMAAPPHIYNVIVMGLGIGQGIASSNHPDLLVALYRAFIVWKARKNNLAKPRVD